MSYPNDNVLVVIGSGPGIGRAVASLFATRSHSKIALIARSQDKLLQDKAAIEMVAKNSNRSVEIRTWATDIINEDKLAETFAAIEQFGVPEVVFFNAARVIPSTQLVTTSSEMEYDFKITNIALHNTAKWAIPLLNKLSKSNPDARPSLLVTNSFLYKEPLPDLFCLSLTKSAQRVLVMTLAKQFGTEGVHIGLISVGGPVIPTHERFNPGYIATQVWKMYRQTPSEFVVDLEISDIDTP